MSRIGNWIIDMRNSESNEEQAYADSQYEQQFKSKYEQITDDLKRCRNVFVYGTLQKNAGNHLLLEGQKFLGDAETVGKYYETISGYVPFVSKLKQLHTIKGELYKIDNEHTMLDLDGLEGHPNWYCREVISVLDENGKEQRAWLYFNDSCLNRPAVEDGDYKKHIWNQTKRRNL